MPSKSPGPGRRAFVKKTAAASGGILLSSRFAAGRVLGANDRIRVGVIGTGGRARYLMRLLKPLPGVEMVAVSDAYEPRALDAVEIVGSGNVVRHAEYRRLLDDKEIDAVVIGAPDHWHRTMLLDALAAGKDAYVEKPISHSLDEGVEMVEGRRGQPPGRPDGDPAAELGPLDPRQADWSILGGSDRSPSSTRTGTSVWASAASTPWIRQGSTGGAGWARPPMRPSTPSASIAGVTSRITAAACSPTS